MPSRRNIPLNIDPIHQNELERLLRSPKTTAAVYRRAIAMNLLARGLRIGELSRLVGLHRVNIFKMRQRFRVCGVKGLHDLPHLKRATPSPRSESESVANSYPLVATSNEITAQVGKVATDEMLRQPAQINSVQNCET